MNLKPVSKTKITHKHKLPLENLIQNVGRKCVTPTTIKCLKSKKKPAKWPKMHSQQTHWKWKWTRHDESEWFKFNSLKRIIKEKTETIRSNLVQRNINVDTKRNSARAQLKIHTKQKIKFVDLFYMKTVEFYVKALCTEKNFVDLFVWNLHEFLCFVKFARVTTRDSRELTSFRLSFTFFLTFFVHKICIFIFIIIIII